MICRSLVVLALFFAPLVAHAQKVEVPTRVMFLDNVLSGVALNAGDATTRTATVNCYSNPSEPVAEYAKARLGVFHTFGAASTVTIVFSCAMDGTNYAQMMSRDISGGASTLSKVTDTYTTGGASSTDPGLGPEFDIRGCKKVKFLFGGAGANGSDLVTVDVSLITGS